MIMYVLEFAAKMPQQCFNKPAQRLRFGYRMTFHGIFTPLSQYRKEPGALFAASNRSISRPEPNTSGLLSCRTSTSDRNGRRPGGQPLPEIRTCDTLIRCGDVASTAGSCCADAAKSGNAGIRTSSAACSISSTIRRSSACGAATTTFWTPPPMRFANIRIQREGGEE